MRMNDIPAKQTTEKLLVNQPYYGPLKNHRLHIQLILQDSPQFVFFEFQLLSTFYEKMLAYYIQFILRWLFWIYMTWNNFRVHIELIFIVFYSTSKQDWRGEAGNKASTWSLWWSRPWKGSWARQEASDERQKSVWATATTTIRYVEHNQVRWEFSVYRC